MPAAALRSALERFLESCRRPVLLEPGQEPLALAPGFYQLSERPNGLLLEAWSETRTWARRLVNVTGPENGRLTLVAERFGGARMEIEISDLDRPVAQPLLRRSQREGLRERLRYWLVRQYPGWRIGELTVGADLQHTLSPDELRPAALRTGDIVAETLIGVNRLEQIERWKRHALVPIWVFLGVMAVLFWAKRRQLEREHK